MSGPAGGDALGACGYGCLGSLVLGGGGAALVLFLLGIRAFVDAAQAPLESAAAAPAFLNTLEGALVLCAAGALAALVAAVALVVSFKELGDREARRQRGPIES